MSEPPTALFVINDLLAVGVVQAIQEKGVRIPAELSIVSFDNTLLAKTTVPALTSIAQPLHEMGVTIVDLLIDEMDGSVDKKGKILFQPELIIRAHPVN